MSVGIRIEHARKEYGKKVIIPDLTLRIRKGEFFTLLGPSGCGKTTLLRMIAGFNSIEGGSFYFGDTKINDVDPGSRNIGMVFQNYAIFPHMSVRKNVEFGLRNRKVDKETIRTETDKFLKLIHIDEYADRMPDCLSGGQQQRVALARALVIKPDVLLMDEPLSNLDAKLRVEMRNVIKNIQNTIGITTVYVTHDQEEAMAVSDRIAVMKDGMVQHVSTPKSIYQRPKNLFVATFIGRSNILKGRLEVRGDQTVILCSGSVIPVDNVRPEERRDRDVTVSVRPEEFEIVTEKTPSTIAATVNDCIFLGLNTHYFLTLSTGEKVEVIRESMMESVIGAGTEVLLSLKKEKINVFNDDGTRNLLTGVNDDHESERTEK